MGFITTLILTITAKLGFDFANKEGLMPQSSYVKRAMDALKRDDLTTAIEQYRLAIKRREPSDLTDMAEEQIRLRIETHISKLQHRLHEIEASMRPKGFIQTLWQRFAPSKRQELEELQQEQVELQEGIAILRNLERGLENHRQA